jgi:hypothetical protein
VGPPFYSFGVPEHLAAPAPQDQTNARFVSYTLASHSESEAGSVLCDGCAGLAGSALRNCNLPHVTPRQFHGGGDRLNPRFAIGVGSRTCAVNREQVPIGESWQRPAVPSTRTVSARSSSPTLLVGHRSCRGGISASPRRRNPDVTARSNSVYVHLITLRSVPTDRPPGWCAFPMEV